MDPDGLSAFPSIQEESMDVVVKAVRAQLLKKSAWLIGDKAPPAAQDCSEVVRA